MEKFSTEPPPKIAASCFGVKDTYVFALGFVLNCVFTTTLLKLLGPLFPRLNQAPLVCALIEVVSMVTLVT